MEKYRVLAAVIAAHPGRKVVGRTRLQKTVMLLQRLGAPMDYDYMIHFYGPYSEGVQADIGLLENFGVVKEIESTAQDGTRYFTLQATEQAEVLAYTEAVEPYREQIALMNETDQVVLELAATYDAFRASGTDHKAALERLKRKKGTKCEGGNTEKALALLKKLGLKAG